jgi:hypothetical protein
MDIAMFLNLTIRLLQIQEFLREKNFKSLFYAFFYINRKVIIIERDLSSVCNKWVAKQDQSVQFVEFTRDNFTKNIHDYYTKSRYYKAIAYLKKGYVCHAMLRDEKVVGDIWYSVTESKNSLLTNPDVKRLKLNVSTDLAYSFDQFVVPAERGNNMAAALVNFQLWSLKSSGYKKVCGYYWSDNIPAIWNNKIMNNFVEVKYLKVNGCYGFKKYS